MSLLRWDQRPPERDSALKQTNGIYRPQGGESWWESGAAFVAVLGLIAIVVAIGSAW